MRDFETMSDETFAAAILGEQKRIRERDFAACDKHLDDLVNVYGIIGVAGVEAEARGREMASGD